MGLAVALAGCAAAPTVEQAGPRIIDLQRDAGAGVAAPDPDRTDVVGAGQLRLLLEELLGVHGALTAQMMREAVDGTAAMPTWIDELDGNTLELAGAIGLVYGPAGADGFEQLWSFHTQFFLDYADALRTGDDEKLADAIDALADYRSDFASFLAAATGGLAPEDAVAALLAEHITQMTDQLDAYRDGDLATSIRVEAEGHDYLRGIGKTLATAISAQSPAAFPGSVDEDRAAYCSILAARLSDVASAAAGATLLDGPGDAATVRWQASLDALTAAAPDVRGVGGLGGPTEPATATALAERLGSLVGGETDPDLLDAIDVLSGVGAAVAAGGAPVADDPAAAVRAAYAAAYRVAGAATPAAG